MDGVAQDESAVGALRALTLPPHDGSDMLLPDALEDVRTKLERDLEPPREARTLRGLYDLLKSDARTRVASILDGVSWEALELLLGCLERSASEAVDSGDREDRRSRPSKVVPLAQKTISELADILRPKELHIMALEHLHAYSERRTIEALLGVLKRSIERMPPLQRSKFLETTLKPALDGTRAVAAACARKQAARTKTSTETAGASDDDGSSGKEESGDSEAARMPEPPPIDDHGQPSPQVCGGAAAAAEAALDFISPLLEQACEDMRPKTADEQGCPESGAAAGESATSATKAALDLSVVAYLGFAMSALEAASEASPSASTGSSPLLAAGLFQAEVNDDSPARALARAQERLATLILGCPAIDLRFILLQGCRMSYAEYVKRRGRRDAGQHVRIPGEEHRLVRLARHAVSGSLPWTSRGVACLAHMVACESRLRDLWVPLVWSPRMERKLFLPHAKTLMRASSKPLVSKGLELACFVAHRTKGNPVDGEASAFHWHSSADLEEWTRGDERGSALHDSDVRQGAASGEGVSKLRRSGAFDPNNFDLLGLMEALIDAIVSCPISSLRSRGYDTMRAFLSAADEASRYRVLKRLIECCPWPNATGLLLDLFRKELDRALRHGDSVGPRNEPHSKVSQGFATPTADDRASSVQGSTRPAATKGGPNGGDTEKSFTIIGQRGGPSMFASPDAGDFISEQLRRACRKGPRASLLMDLDRRTGGLALARYAYAVDRDRSRLAAQGGVLQLRSEDRLRRNQTLVEGLLDNLGGAAANAESLGPDHFRLFILEDAAKQCLEEMRR